MQGILQVSIVHIIIQIYAVTPQVKSDACNVLCVHYTAILKTVAKDGRIIDDHPRWTPSNGSPCNFIVLFRPCIHTYFICSIVVCAHSFTQIGESNEFMKKVQDTRFIGKPNYGITESHADQLKFN